jgi:hypothetical protein
VGQFEVTTTSAVGREQRSDLATYETREQRILCPYCGESIGVIIDCSVPQQRYIEDCQVCCRPIEFNVVVDQQGEPKVAVFRENE